MTLMTADTRPAQLLRPLKCYRKPAVWGFPIDDKLIAAEYKKKVALSGGEEVPVMPHMQMYTSRLIQKCSDIWDSPRPARLAHVLSGRKEKNKWVMAIVACTRREDKFLPPPEKIEEMKKVFLEVGFKGEPGWYTGHDIR